MSLNKTFNSKNITHYYILTSWFRRSYEFDNLNDFLFTIIYLFIYFNSLLNDWIEI